MDRLLALQSKEYIEAVRSTKYKNTYGYLDKHNLAMSIFSRLLDTQRRLLEAVTPVMSVGYHWTQRLQLGAMDFM